MNEPSPLHRDPDDVNDCDFGCFSDEANQRVADVVDDLIAAIEAGSIDDTDELVYRMREGLSEIESACDTVVKENVAWALEHSMREAGLEEFGMRLYGW